MLKRENRIHAITAEKALQAVYDDTGEDAIADMLSDLRHLCDKQGRDFAKIDRRAYRNYSGEGGAT
ncbi:MAG: hypothetical protein ABI579_05290 [Candidatus Sumerlaeota bacterium]